MFSHDHYVPILKWRQGEFRALEKLPPETKAHLTPLVEIPPIPWSYDDEEPRRSLDVHMARVPDQIEKTWGVAPILIDLGLLDSDARMSSGAHPLTFLAAQLAELGLKAVPVTGLDRDPEYQTAARKAHLEQDCGLCLRLTIEDVFSDELAKSIRALRLSPETVDLVIDLGSIQDSQLPVLRATLPDGIKRLPVLRRYRSFTVAGTAFPLTLGDLNVGTSEIRRAEWALWLSLYKRGSKLVRIPTFGDYAVAHPETIEIDPRMMRVSASIRYTADESWVVFRGRWLRDPRYKGFEQFRDLSSKVIEHPAYQGRRFSWGDRFIWECAKSKSGTGNPSTWRQVANSHHITLAVHQIANLGDS